MPDKSKKHKKKILFVISGLQIAGAERALCNLLEGIQEDFFIEVISLAGSGEMSEFIKKMGIVVHEMSLGKVFNRLRECYRLHQIVRSFKPDIIQGWMYHANLVGHMLRLFYPKAQLFLSIRQALTDLSIEKKTTRIVIRIDALLSRWAHRIIYNSHAGQRDHEAFRYTQKNGTVIPNGFNHEAFFPQEHAKENLCKELNIPFESVLIGLVGRFHKVKDYPTFIKAAGMLYKKNPEVFFILAGREINCNNSILTGYIDQFAHLQEKMRLLGVRQDILSITSALDISTNCSLSEGMSNALAESLLCGSLCVATDVGDSAYLIGDTGYVIPIKSPEALCGAWEKLINMSPSEQKEMSIRGRNHIINSYSIDSMIQRYKVLYSSSISRQMDRTK